MMLAQLEGEIGAPLSGMDRENRLTALGRLVLEESQRATDVFDGSAEAIRRHAVSIAGIVRVAAVPSATVSLLPAVIDRLRATHPDVRIEIGDVDSTAARRRVAQDEADIGILSARPGDPEEGKLIQREDLGIVCAEDGPIHRAHMGRAGAFGWDLLEREPLIAKPPCSLVDDPIVRALLGRARRWPETPRRSCPSLVADLGQASFRSTRSAPRPTA